MSTPALIACAAVSLALAIPVAASGALLDAAHRARGAGDAAALAAADAATGWADGEPCDLARVVAASVGAQLEQCALDADAARVRVTVRIDTPLGPVRGRARAGPPATRTAPA